MTNKELIRFLRELEAQEEDFIRSLIITRIKRRIVTRMLKMYKKEPC